MNIERKREEPSKFEKVEYGFFKKLQASMGENLALYCVTGSLARKDVIEGWSDIDVLIIVKEYSPKVFSDVAEALRSNESDIKIGTTIYSVGEFARTEVFLDPKSQYSLELIRNGIYKPRLIDRQIDVFEPKRDVIEWFDSVNLTRLLFDLKRSALNPSPEQERGMYKNMITIFKILLYRKGELAMGYDETIQKTYGSLGYPNKIPTVSEIMTAKDDYTGRLQYYIDFIVWLDKNEIAKK